MVRALLQDPTVARVVATSRDPDSSPGLAALAAEVGPRLARVSLDLTDERSIAAAAARVSGWTDRLHLLVNVSGLLHDGSGVAPERRLEEVSQSRLQAVFLVNAMGPILVAKAFLPLLAHDERAVLANVSARVGSIGDNRLGGWYAYRASKAAQNQLTKTLSIELRRRAKQVVVVALHPGTVDTDLSKPFQRSVPADKLFSAEDSANRLLEVMRGLEQADSGRFFAYDGTDIPW